MKTRYKIVLIVIVVIGGFFAIPPVTTGICDAFAIYDTCPRISGMQIPFGGPVILWSTLPPTVHDMSENCDEICPDKTNIPQSMRDCSVYDKGSPEFFECVEHLSDRTVIDGEMVEQICMTVGGTCPSYYVGNIQEDGSIMVGITVSHTERETQYMFLIKNKTLSYTVMYDE